MTTSLMKTLGQRYTQMSRRRYQRGQVFLRGKKSGQKWVGRFREDVRTTESLSGVTSVNRIHKSVVLGTLQDFPTKRLAQRALDQILAGINSPTYQPQTCILFRDFAQRWMDTVLTMHKPSSQNSEKVHMTKHLIPFFGNHNLRDITPALVQQFISAQTSCSPKTVRNIYATFRSAWKTAKAWGYVTHVVNEGVVLPRLRPVERPSFTLDQMQAIIREAEEPFKTFFWLAAETGMRAGELCGIRWDDIDANASRMQVRQSVWRGTVGSPKSVAGTRTIPISTQLCEHLASRRAVQGGLLFVTRNGQPWDTRFIVRDRLHPILNRLGIPPAGLHAFRHGNASYRLQQGEDVKTLATRLGHSDPSVTLKVYAHAAHRGGQDLSNIMGGVLDPSVPRIFPQVVAPIEVCA